LIQIKIIDSIINYIRNLNQTHVISTINGVASYLVQPGIPFPTCGQLYLDPEDQKAKEY
jgi:hypothetical protein